MPAVLCAGGWELVLEPVSQAYATGRRPDQPQPVLRVPPGRSVPEADPFKTVAAPTETGRANDVFSINRDVCVSSDFCYHLLGLFVQLKTVEERELEVALSRCSLKVSSFQASIEALTVHLHYVESLAALNGSRRKREARLTRMIAQQHALDGVVRMVAPDPRTVLLFGSGFFGRNARKGDSPKRPMVVRALRRHLARHRQVVLINEYLTSQVCWRCSHDCKAGSPHPTTVSPSGYLVLQKCHARMEKEDEDDHRDLCCHNSVHNPVHRITGSRINRDLNAACNIMSIFHSLVTQGARPPCLTKPVEEEEEC